MTRTLSDSLARAYSETDDSIYWNSQQRKLTQELQDKQRWESVPETLARMTPVGEKVWTKMREEQKQKALNKVTHDQWRTRLAESGAVIDTEYGSTLQGKARERYDNSTKLYRDAITKYGLDPDRASLLLMDDGVKKDLKMKQYLAHAREIEFPAWLEEQLSTNPLRIRTKDLGSFNINSKGLTRAQRTVATSFLTDAYLKAKGIYGLNQDYLHQNEFYAGIESVEAKSMASYMKYRNAQIQFEKESDGFNLFIEDIKAGRKPNLDNLLNILSSGTKTPGGKDRRSFGDVWKAFYERMEAEAKVDPKGTGAKINTYLQSKPEYTGADGKSRPIGATRAETFEETVADELSNQEEDDKNKRELAEANLKSNYDAEVNEILAEDISDKEKADKIDALTPQYVLDYRKEVGGDGQGLPSFISNSAYARKNTYATDKTQLAALAKQQGNVLFESDLVNRDLTLINELKNQGIVKPSKSEYIGNLPGMKATKDAIKKQIGTLWKLTGLDTFEDADGTLFYDEAIVELENILMNEGVLLANDPRQAVKNARTTLLDELKLLKSADEARNTYLFRRTRGSDHKTNALVALNDLLGTNGAWHDANDLLNNAPPAEELLSALRVLPKDLRMEIIKTAKGRDGTPFTKSLYQIYKRSITPGEERVFTTLDEDDFMGVLVTQGKITNEPLKLSPNQKRKQEVMQACHKDPLIRRLLGVPFWKFRHSTGSAKDVEFIRECKAKRAALVSLYGGGS